MVLFWTVRVTVVNVTLYFYYVCTYRKVKTPIIWYRTITHVGIVWFEGKTPSSNTKNTITMVEPFNATAAWLWWIIQYPHGKIFGRGWLRAGCKGFIQLFKLAANFFLVNSLIYFIIFRLFNLYCCQNDGINPPPALPPGQTSSPVPPWLCLRVFGWLLFPFVVWQPNFNYFLSFSSRA